MNSENTRDNRYIKNNELVVYLKEEKSEIYPPTLTSMSEAHSTRS